MSKNKVGFIGAGNMATAIINGMLKSKEYNPCDIYIFDLDENKKEAMKKNGVSVCKTSIEVLNSSEYVVLAIKPQNYPDVLTEIKDAVENNHVIISIAAGISIEFIKSYISAECDFVRVMPNTPLLLGCGASAICSSANISKDKLDVASKLFSASGIVEFLDEDKMNAVIAVNGSSPAYVYLFAKALLDYSHTQGIDEKSAVNLVCSTLEGSAKMIRESGNTPQELIKAVSSPGGTTLEALKVLEENKFYETLISAMENCTRRANELSK